MVNTAVRNKLMAYALEDAYNAQEEALMLYGETSTQYNEAVRTFAEVQRDCKIAGII